MMTTHPRACSTAFERVMMTRPELLTCVHEPFGEAFYYSHAERLGSRYGLDSDQMRQAREDSGHSLATYRGVFDQIELQQQASVGPPIPAAKTTYLRKLIVYVYYKGWEARVYQRHCSLLDPPRG